MHGRSAHARSKPPSPPAIPQTWSLPRTCTRGQSASRHCKSVQSRASARSRVAAARAGGSRHSGWEQVAPEKPDKSSTSSWRSHGPCGRQSPSPCTGEQQPGAQRSGQQRQLGAGPLAGAWAVRSECGRSHPTAVGLPCNAHLAQRQVKSGSDKTSTQHEKPTSHSGRCSSVRWESPVSGARVSLYRGNRSMSSCCRLLQQAACSKRKQQWVRNAVGCCTVLCARHLKAAQQWEAGQCRARCRHPPMHARQHLAALGGWHPEGRRPAAAGRRRPRLPSIMA